MWDMEYKSRSEYITALQNALEGKDIPDADKMVTDIKNFFFMCNHQSIGDTEVIAKLPDPETLAMQYDGKEYTNPRVLKKKGSAKFMKRVGIFLLTCLMVLLGIASTIGFMAMFLGGFCLIALAAIFQFNLLELLPGQMVAVMGTVPLQFFEGDPVANIFFASTGVFMILLAGTVLKALKRLRKKYHNWTLKQISGCFRLPVSLDDVYSKAWRVSVYIFLPLSMVVSLVSAGMIILGVSFTF